MMQRREFMRRCALIAAGVVAADQLDILEMSAPRRLFAGADFERRLPLTITHERGPSTIAEAWRKVQADVREAFQYRSTEYDLIIAATGYEFTPGGKGAVRLIHA